MALDEILKKLTAEEAAIVTSAIDFEKQAGIEAVRKRAGEVTKHMTAANLYRDALRAAELDPDGDVAEQLVALKQTNTGKPKSELEKQVLTLTKSVQQLTAKATEKEKEALESQNRYKSTRLHNELSTAFGETLVAKEFVIPGLIRDGKVKLNDLDSVVWVAGENEVDFKSGVDQFKKTYPHLVKNTQSNGGGSNGGQGGSAKTVTRAEFEALSATDQAATAASARKGELKIV
jgi:hypothetical protein